MFTFFALAILFIGPIVLAAMRLRRRMYSYLWIAGVAFAAIAWSLTLASAGKTAATPLLTNWHISDQVFSSPVLLLDDVSWAFSIALTALALAAILTGPSRIHEKSWMEWASILSLTAGGVLASLAGNPLTVLLSWGALDIIELLVVLGQARGRVDQIRLSAVYTTRLFGLLLLAWAFTVEQSHAFSPASETVDVFLFLAAGSRIAASAMQSTPDNRQTFSAVLRLAPAAAGFVLIARISAPVDGLQSLTYLVEVLFSATALVVLLGATIWVTGGSKPRSEAAWIVVTASLASIAALRGQTAASATWGVVSILGGGLLFLPAVGGKRIQRLLLVSGLFLFGLPYTPSGPAAGLFSPPFQPILIPFLFAHAALVFGFLMRANQPRLPFEEDQPWAPVLYTLGLILLFITLGITAAATRAGFEEQPNWWAGVAVALLSSLAYLLAARYRWDRVYNVVPTGLQRGNPLRWLYGFLLRTYRLAGRAAEGLHATLEGEAGLLWTLLFLTLIFTLLVQRSPG